MPDFFDEQPKYNRRSSDGPNQTDRIGMLIEQASDPKDRAFLVVLQSINNNTIQNSGEIGELTKSLAAHAKVFADHARNEEAMVNRGKGMWKVIAWVFGAVQAVAIVIGTSVVSDIKQMRTDGVANELLHQKLDMRLSNTEKRVEDLNFQIQRLEAQPTKTSNDVQK